MSRTRQEGRGEAKAPAWTLAELARESAVPARTIRFYIARGLLPGPAKAGRGATYGRGHRERLREIGRLQAEGLTLQEITRRLAGEGTRSPGVAPTAWWQYAVAEDVVVSVRADASPWRLRQINAWLAQLGTSGGEDAERKGHDNP